MKPKNKFLLQRFVALFLYKDEFVIIFDKIIIVFGRTLQET
jgi:hypothetical protein